METFASEQARWAELLIDAIHASGVEHVIVSPGSRSTPFVLAAEGHQALEVHDVIDERVASFVALGIGRATGTPALLICTSGSAGAHYYPAVIEASMARVPLVVLTADRPIALRDCGANQTIDQNRLFGTHVRLFTDLGEVRWDDAGVRGLRRTAARAVARAMGPDPGAVHLNAPARKPLEPPLGPRDDASRGDTRAVPGIPPSPTAIYAARLAPPEDALRELAERISSARRGLIVAGPGPVAQADAREAVALLSARTGFPVLAEATSQLRFGGHAETTIGAVDALFRSPVVREKLAPEVVLQLGATPVAKGAEMAFADLEGERVVVAPHGHPDPHGNAALLIASEIELTSAALAQQLDSPLSAEGRGYMEAWASLDAIAWEAASAICAEHGEALSEAVVVRSLLAAVPDGGQIAIGNSLAIRHVDAWVPPTARELAVLHQRGASGIDGALAGAVGAALSTRKPTALLYGDVSFVHDLGALVAARDLGVPLVAVVLDNGGGRIFDQLPIGRFPRNVLRHFTTPPQVDVAAIAAALGLASATCEDGPELERILKQAFETEACTIVRAIVPEEGALEDTKSLFDEVDRRARAELGSP